MAKGMSMKVLLQLQTKEFQRGLRGIQRQLNGFKNFMKSAFALGSITMFGKQMIQVGKDFEDAMARVQAVSNATTDEFRKMQKEAERLGSTTRYTATEAANALENLTRNGMSATDATKALSSVLQLAQANAIGLAEAADIITNTLNMFNLGVEETSRVNDVLSSTASHAATNVTELSEALVNAAPAANVLGLSLEETSAAIGALAQRGVKGAEAGTKMRIALQKMADPKVIAKMKDYGIEVDENSIKTEGLRKTIEKIAKANLSLGDLGKIFDAKSAMAVQLLTASLGDVDRLLEALGNAAGETARMANQGVGSVSNELNTLKSMYEGLLISMSKKTSGMVKGVVKLLQNIIGNFNTIGGTIMNIASVAVPLLTKRVITLGTSLRTMFTQAAAGAATMKVAMGDWITIIATLVTWVGTALVGAWNRANQAHKEAQEHMAEVEKEGRKMQSTIDDLKDKIGDGSNSASLNYAVGKACEMFPQFADAIKSAREEAKKLNDWEILKNELQSIADLQKEIERNKVKKEELNTQLTEAGEMFYKDIKPEGAFKRYIGQFFRRLSHGDSRNAQMRDELQMLIGNQLEDKGKSETDIKSLANELAEAYYGKGNFRNTKEGGHSDVEAAKNAVKEILEREKIKIDWTPGSKDWNLIQEWMASMDPNGSVNGNRNRRGERLSTDIGNTQQEVHVSDSTIRAESYNQFKKGLEFAEEELKKNTKTTAEFNKEFAKKVDEFVDNVMGLGFDNNSEEAQYAKDLYDKYSKYLPKTTTPTGGSGGSGGSTSKVKTDSDKVKDAIDDYNEEVTKLNNRLAAGTITTENYESELDKLEDKTWEAITAISDFAGILDQLGKGELGKDLGEKYATNRANENAEQLVPVYEKLAKYLTLPEKGKRSRDYDRKSKNEQQEEDVRISLNYADAIDDFAKDLEEAIENGDYDLVKDDALKMLEGLKVKAKEAADAADTLQAKLNLSEAITKLDEQIKALNQTAMDSFEGFANSMDRIMSGLWAIAEIFDEDLRDSPMFQAFEAFSSVLNSSIQIMQGVAQAIQLVKTIQTKAALQKVKDASVEVAANQAVTASEAEKAAAEATAAAAGGAASVASVPFVGPALAVAAAASIAAALLAAFSKFENGGLVGGHSYSGDKVPALVNSGEAVLTRAQQASLWKAIQTGNFGGGGNVEFVIRGDQLVGTLNNYNRLRR